MLEIHDLHVSYGKHPVLQGLNLTCKQGEITVIIGQNGCGKSTLLKTIANVLAMEQGNIQIDGLSLSGLSDSERAQKIAYLSQGKTIPDICASRMVLHGRFPYLSYPRKYRKDDFAIAEQAMKQMGISHYGDRMMRELSGGMRQKVYIAMALAQQSDVILMDEPTTYLDIGQQFLLADTIRDLAQKGKTLVLVLHDLILALKLADQIAVMQNGKIALIGKPNEISESQLLKEIYGVSVKSVMIDGNEEYVYQT